MRGLVAGVGHEDDEAHVETLRLVQQRERPQRLGSVDDDEQVRPAIVAALSAGAQLGAEQQRELLLVGGDERERPGHPARLGVRRVGRPLHPLPALAPLGGCDDREPDVVGGVPRHQLRRERADEAGGAGRVTDDGGGRVRAQRQRDSDVVDGGVGAQQRVQRPRAQRVVLAQRVVVTRWGGAGPQRRPPAADAHLQRVVVVSAPLPPSARVGREGAQRGGVGVAPALRGPLRLGRRPQPTADVLEVAQVATAGHPELPHRAAPLLQVHADAHRAGAEHEHRAPDHEQRVGVHQHEDHGAGAAEHGEQIRVPAQTRTAVGQPRRRREGGRAGRLRRRCDPRRPVHDTHAHFRARFARHLGAPTPTPCERALTTEPGSRATSAPPLRPRANARSRQNLVRAPPRRSHSVPVRACAHDVPSATALSGDPIAE